jgi:hypothetical protein
VSGTTDGSWDTTNEKVGLLGITTDIHPTFPDFLFIVVSFIGKLYMSIQHVVTVVQQQK